jgi:hypothetical protein
MGIAGEETAEISPLINADTRRSENKKANQR